LVGVAKHAQLFQFSMANVQAVALQALHLSENKQYATLASVAISASNSWTLHIVSGTNQRVKRTTKFYGSSAEGYCAFGASPERSQPDGIILPINRHMAVTFPNAEKGRFRRHRRRRRGQPLPPPEAAGITLLPPAYLDADVARVGGKSLSPEVQRGAVRDSGAPDSHASGVFRSGSSEDGGGSDARSSSSLQAAQRAPAQAVRSAPPAPLAALSPLPNGVSSRMLAGHSTRPTPPAQPISAFGAGTGRASAGRTSKCPPQSMSTPEGAAAAPTAVPGGSPTPHSRKVGKSVLRMHQSAVAKVGSIFNKLWTGCKCAACAEYDVEA